MNVSFLNLQPTVSRCGRRGPSALALACAVALVAGGTPGARAQDPAPTVARSDGAKAGGAKAGGATKALAANKLVPATAETAAVTPAVVSAIEIAGDTRRTTVKLTVDRPVVANIFTLAAPYRAIIDIPGLEFRLPAGAGQRGHERTGWGLVAGFRYGQFEAGRSRVVLDAVAPMLIENAGFEPPDPGLPGTPGRLSFDLVQITADEFAALVQVNAPTAAARAAPTVVPTFTPALAPTPARVTPPALRPSQADHTPPEPPQPTTRQTSAAAQRLAALAAGQPIDPPGRQVATGRATAGANGRARPVIVIDPGHGGIDPGTVAGSNLTEKSVVLAVARQLGALLAQSRRFDVRMTRHDDVFVSLDQRVDVSRRLAADLFISIHADSLALAERELAQAVHGATIYTLSERASDEAARLLADKENAADLLAGLDAVPASDEAQVRTILFDLVRRETANHAAEFRQHLLGALRGKVPLAKDPQRAAAFKVLKQPETPAVLIELGYMSNAEDLARLSRPEWQRQMAIALAAAIEQHFAPRPTKARSQ